MSLEESNRRINRLIAMHKKLSEANMASLPSQVEKRKRSTSAVNASNTVHIREADQLQQLTSSPTPISPVHKRSKRVGSKNSLVWKHFETGLRGQDPIATCKYCGQVYACDRSTHGISTLAFSCWYCIILPACLSVHYIVYLLLLASCDLMIWCYWRLFICYDVGFIELQNSFLYLLFLLMIMIKLLFFVMLQISLRDASMRVLLLMLF